MRQSPIVLLVCVALSGCAASYPTQPTKAPAVTLFITQGARGPVPISNSLLGYGVYTLDSDGAYQNVSGLAIFESSDANVARINNRSVVAAGAGEATITVRYAGLQASTPIVVYDSRVVRYPRLSIIYRTPDFAGGRTQTAAGFQRTALSANEDVTAAVTWQSSNPAVATIDQAGIITGIGVGTTLITAVYEGQQDWYWLSIVPR